MGVVQVIRSAEGEVIDGPIGAPATQLRNVTVEPLDLGKEGRLRKVRVDNADRVVGVHGGHEAVARVLNGSQVSWGNISGQAGECKVFRRKVDRF